MKTIRQSMLNEYDSCPFRCLQRWGKFGVEEHEDEPNKYAAAGTLLHKVAELYNSFRLRGIELTIDQLRYFYVKHFNKIPSCLFYDPEEQNSFYVSYWKQFIWLYQYRLKYSVLPIEVEKKFKVKKLFDVPCTGIIDLIEETEEGLHIVDYKTSSVPFTYKSLDSNIQIYIYTAACEFIYGKTPARFTFVFTKGETIRSFVITAKFMTDMYQKTHKMWSNIKNGKFEPCTKDLRFCVNYCSSFKKCPAFRGE